MYDEMFSVSTEEPVHVRVCFDNTFSIKEKLMRLLRRRRFATLTEQDGALYYEDTLRGIADFAHFLRQYGKSARVEAPEELKTMMVDSARLLLERYREVNHE